MCCICFFFASLFQEQLRRRREEEEHIAQQNEFLRASLRGSRKLQVLQDNHPLASEQRPPVGVDNDAFISDEDVERILGKWPYHIVIVVNVKKMCYFFSACKCKHSTKVNVQPIETSERK